MLYTISSDKLKAKKDADDLCNKITAEIQAVLDAAN